jgi:hypothetical protein
MNSVLILSNFALITFYALNINAEHPTTKRPVYGYYNNRQFTTRHRIFSNHKEPDQLFFGNKN